MLEEILNNFDKMNKEREHRELTRKNEILLSDIGVQDAFDYYNIKDCFEPGNIIEFIPGLSNTSFPSKGEKAVFVRYFTEEEMRIQKKSLLSDSSPNKHFLLMDCLIMAKHEIAGFINLPQESWRFQIKKN